MKRILITLCGRAGSKGFANKNCKLLGGQPLVNYSLAAARLFLQSCPQYTVDVCLNTDSPLLAQQAAAYAPGTVVLARGEALAGDTVPKEAVYLDCLQRMEAQNACRYDCLVDLDLTSPLRRADDLARAMALFEGEEGLDLVMSAAPSRRNPYFNMAQLDADGYARRVIDNHNTARQQAPACYDINASLYIFSRAFLLGGGAEDLWGGRIRLYEMADTAVLDIDSEEDFRLMEVVAAHLFAHDAGFAAVRQAAAQPDCAPAPPCDRV